MKHIAIIGSSGAIGNALIQHYLGSKETETLYAFSRSETELPDNNIINHYIDLEKPESIEAAAKLVPPNSLDMVIAATGILHTDGDPAVSPEKNLQQLDAGQLQRVFSINSIGPALLMKHFLPLLKNSGPNVFALLSARVGSISDNRLGGWYSYRASKAALNMLIKTAAIESGRRNRESIIVGLHPGTVDSKLSSPFQARVPKEKLFSPAISAEYLAHVIDKLDSSKSGLCIDWNGKIIPA
ncbi:MAG: SDR family NAD(P)-dependent oxidoreductase [Gammaproteobacteria bacterium]|nr:SDR family NAD(P)-dependent oxidoreductase [Gammaproteobacteria bacterium]